MARLKRVIGAILSLSSILCFSQQASTQNKEEDEPANIQELRAEYFARQRGLKPGQISVVPRLKALQQLEQMRQKEKQLLQASPQTGAATTNGPSSFTSLSISTSQWTSIGPAPVSEPGGPFSGRVTALAVDPTNSSVIYLGAADGGVWKTTDAGQHWVPLTDGQPSLSTGAVAIDPGNTNIIYVGTGEANGSGDNYPGAGILKSTDGGQTWTNIQGPFLNDHISAVAVDPNNSSNVLVSSSNTGLQRSTDGGNTWNQAFNFRAYSLIFDPGKPGVVYAAGTDSAAKSVDSGATWNVILRATASSIRASLALSGNTLYALFSDSTLFKSTDSGSTWTQLSPPTGVSFCPRQCFYNLVVGASPTNPNFVYVGAINILYSSDGGTTWLVDGGTHVDHHAIAFSADGATVFSGSDGGVWSAPAGSDVHASQIPWTNLNQTLGTLQFYRGISIGNNDPNLTLGGTQDNGCELYSGGTTWTVVAGGDGFSTLLNPLDPLTMYCTAQGAALFKSTDGGNSFITISPTNGGRFDTLLAMDPSAPQHLYTDPGAGQIYQSNDAGSTWQIISGSFSNILSINVAPTDSNTVYAANNFGVVVSRNALAGTSSTWTQFSPPDNAGVVRAVADPHDATIAYAARGSTFGPRVFKITGSGATWTDISGNLPIIAVNDIVVDPDQPNTLYVGTDIGVFSTTDGGTTWNTLVQGLPRSIITGIALDGSSRVLRVATHGRSMWDLQLPPAPGTGAGTLSGNVTNISDNSPVPGATVSFSGGSTTTDNNGFYQFANVPSGTYNVTAVATGFFSVTESAAVSPNQTTTLNFRLPTGGKIAGTVFDISTNKPIPGATVHIAGGSVTVDLILTTDSNGAFATDFVPVGHYTLNVSATGFQTATGVTTAVTAGQTTTINIALSNPEMGTLSGTVKDISTNAPIVGATVSFSGGTTTTKSDGSYTFFNVPVGTYSITAVASGYFSSTQSATIHFAGDTAIANFNLATGGKLAGTVTTSAGAAISGATVTISGGSVTTNVTVITSASGAYATDFIPVGNYTITVSATGFTTQSKTATVTTGQTTTVNFTLSSGGGTGTLSGTVVDISTNNPISGATVSFSGGSVTTATNGTYQFVNVAAGTYNVTAMHTGYFASTQSATVNSGATTILNFKLATGGKLAGTVTNSSGAGISGATVMISGGSVTTNVTLATSSTGTYASNFVPVGTYTITVSATGFTTQSQSATVNTGQTTTVNFTLGSGGGTGTLSGTVVDISTNNPISGATVSFSGGSTTTASNGTYQFVNVATGTYNVTAMHTGFFSVTQSATVNSGATTTLNFKLATGGKLAGTVTHSNGTVIAGATVKISGGKIATTVTVTTNSSGVYNSSWVPVGTYTITVSPSGLTPQSKTATANTGATTTVNFVF